MPLPATAFPCCHAHDPAAVSVEADLAASRRCRCRRREFPWRGLLDDQGPTSAPDDPLGRHGQVYLARRRSDCTKLGGLIAAARMAGAGGGAVIGRLRCIVQGGALMPRG